MINRKMEPAKLKILPTPKEKFRMVGQVTALDTFQNNTRDFHESGLFSTSIFGRVGSQERLTRMAYIDIYVPIFHPRIFNHLCSLITSITDRHGCLADCWLNLKEPI